MENPVIIQFDDDDNYFTVLELIGYNMGFTTAARAQNIEATRKIIAQIEKKEIKPDIAIISNYLGYNFEDGGKLAKKLREIVPDIKIVAYVTDPETTWGDQLALKSGRDQQSNLVHILEAMTGRTFVASNLPEGSEPKNENVVNADE